jgi:hypothetical protein
MKVITLLLGLLLLLSCSEIDETKITSLNCYYSGGWSSDPEGQQPHYTYNWTLYVEVQLSDADTFILQMTEKSGIRNVIEQKTDLAGYYKKSFPDYGSETGIRVVLNNGESESMKITHGATPTQP